MTMDDHACVSKEEEEDDLFFDTREEISAFSDSYPGSPSNHDSIHEENSIGWFFEDPQYKVWISNPSSIQERRDRFMQWLGLDPGQSPRESSVDLDIDRIRSDGGAVLMTSASENSSSTCSWLNDDHPSKSGDAASDDSFEFRIKNSDYGSMSMVDQFSNDGALQCFGEAGSNRCITVDEFDRTFGPSSFVQKLMQRQDNGLNNTDNVFRRRNRWLRRLGVVACIVDNQPMEVDSPLPDSNKSLCSRAQRVKVRSNKKRLKEFSAVYLGQDIKAHNGAIATMKFSPDGRYLASGGEDGVVRVWQVMECERRDERDIPENDPFCVYFKVNNNSELGPLFVDKYRLESRKTKRTTDSACVVVPPEVFHISEKPLHEFYGHDGDVLDISWSNGEYLLSSSVDKTVRLWKVGYDDCLKLFVHNNYVTCVQFNPVDENYFVSGSIDGKVRIWEIREHHVVDWIDIRDIVSALCYSLDGKGIVVGSMTGDCRFYNASDHHLLLDAAISFLSKKKSSDKRITGFQYCPSDHRRLMVTSADSQICILDGLDVISKYKGLRNARSQISASFTSDGKHIVSASEDSYVYIWSHSQHEPRTQNHIKSNRSYERFMSSHASVAIPWIRPASMSSLDSLSDNNIIYLSPVGSFALSHEFCLELSIPKGSATWPEEKLTSSFPMDEAPTLCKSHLKFLKTTCRNSPHAWGQVIVTAGWDGRIRSFQNYGLPVIQ